MLWPIARLSSARPATPGAMTPKNGGKIELRLDSSSPDSAEYQALLHTHGTTFEGRARVGQSAGPKQVDFDWSAAASGALPEWLAADARAALKAALRTARAEGRWPRRITRWRPEPEG
jgi:hypothetical protein